MAERGIAIRSYWALPPARSYIVYYKGNRISPGDMQEDGFRSRSKAVRFASRFLSLHDEFAHSED